MTIVMKNVRAHIECNTFKSMNVICEICVSGERTMDNWKNVSLRVPHRMSELVAEAARRQCTKPSEYIRQAVVVALREDGLEPASPKEIA
jgi:hypothetical protein